MIAKPEINFCDYPLFFRDIGITYNLIKTNDDLIEFAFYWLKRSEEENPDYVEHEREKEVYREVFDLIYEFLMGKKYKEIKVV